ncbi:putative membrane-associated, metal-dependent hydrolase [Escherichia coli]|uniref:Putative membrane-associated, metal-dependent hydrolase n=1 Tax=Escherichia coli TaxID=562 RepID=A0A376RQ82_ECOLX|nr:putative membrane-associated, metal-dependent hydrolase [Escherichia coli]
MLSIYSDEYQKTVLSGKHTPDFIVLFFFVVSAITTIACGYTEKNATGNVLLLFLLLLLAHRNTLTSITALLFLFCCALYAPAGMTYGKINNSFIVALLQTTADEAAEFTGMIPVYHFLGQCRDSGIHGDFLADTPPRSP